MEKLVLNISLHTLPVSQIFIVLKQRVKATLLDGPAGQNITATFTASGFVTGEPGLTAITGTVLDNQDNPLPGVTISVDGTTRTGVTDAQGIFKISNVPVGPVHLIVDGSTTTATGEYPSLSYNLVTISGVDNPLSAPIYMVKLNTESMVYAGLQDAELILPKVPGFKLEVPAGSVTFPDGSKEGYLSVTVVNSSKVPMAPPNGMQPQFIVTIQPTGAKFDPPARLTLPNVDAHPAGAQVEMFSYDHDLEEFVAIGLGTVSKDSLTIQSNPGVGVVKAGWHCGAQPGGSGCCEGPGDCGPCAEVSGACLSGCKPVQPGTKPLPLTAQEPNNCLIEFCGEQPADGSDWTNDLEDTEANFCKTCEFGEVIIDEEKSLKPVDQIAGNCKTETCGVLSQPKYDATDISADDVLSCKACVKGNIQPVEPDSKECCNIVGWNKGGNKNAAGKVVCCHGKKKSCGRYEHTDEVWGEGEVLSQIHNECIIMHEDAHKPYVRDCTTCGKSARKPSISLLYTECESYKVEIECLKRREPRCKGDIDCSFGVSILIREARSAANNINGVVEPGEPEYKCL